MDSVPEDDDVGHQSQGTELVLLSLTITLAQLAPLPVKDFAGQTVEAFSTVELDEGGAALFSVVEVIERVQGFVDASELR